MKVLHSESSTGWGGQENRTLNEMIALRSLGHEAMLACPPQARLGERAGEAGFRVFPVAMRGALDLPALRTLRRILRHNGIDIVNTHSGRDTQLAGMAARSLGCLGARPRVVRTRHLALPISSRFGYATLPDHVVTVSRAVREQLIASGVPAAKISAITTGVDCRRFDPDVVLPVLRNELGLASDAFVVGMVAILRFKKGHQDLLDAAVEVVKELPQAVFVIAGDGPQRDNIERGIAARGLQSQVRMLGLRRDIPAVLRSLDLFVLPTHQEAFGTSCLEAQAMGVPVIASRVGGVPETVQEGVTGLLTPAQDSQALARAIIELGRDPERCRAMGTAGRIWVLAEHSIERMAERMVRLYDELLQGHGRG